MSLWIVAKDSHEVHIGTSFHKPNDIELIQADGDELEYIRENFKNLPMPPLSQRVAKWFGESAKFIVHNIDWVSKERTMGEQYRTQDVLLSKWTGKPKAKWGI